MLNMLDEKITQLKQQLADQTNENRKLAEDLSYYQFRTTQQITKLADTIEEKNKEIAEYTALLYKYKQRTTELDIINFEMRTLLKAGKGFSDILNLDGLLKTFMAVIREKLGVVSSCVLLREDPDNDNHYQVKAFRGLNQYYKNESDEEEDLYMLKIPKDNGLLWGTIQQGEAISVRDLEKAPRFKEAFESWNLSVLDADIWVPIIKKGEVLGILTLGAKKNGESIKENDYQYVQDLASIVATNIDSTVKFEKTQTLYKNIKTLYSLNQQLINVQDLKEIRIKTIQTAVEAVNAQRGNMMEINPVTNQLEVKAVWGDLPDEIRDRINNGESDIPKSFRIGEGVAGQCIETGQTIRINDRKKIPQVGNQPVYAIMAVPMIRNGRVVGVITMTNKIKEENNELVLNNLGRFTEEDSQLVFNLADQSALNLQKAKLYNASITDRMTGLYNNRHFEFQFETVIEHAYRTQGCFALIITDIDHFKNFNDTYGHSAGDMVLKEVATCLTSSLPNYKEAMSFRYGGEEFCALLPEADLQESLKIAEKFRRKVETMEVVYQEKVMKVTVSVGVALFPTHARTSVELFEEADKSLYACKENGRNQVRFKLIDSNEFERYVENVDVTYRAA